MALLKTYRLLLGLLLVLLSVNSYAQSSSCIAIISPAEKASYCPGGSILLKANTGTNLAYQWYRDGAPIPNATAPNYTAAQPGTYKVLVSSTAATPACARTFSPEVLISQSENPATPDFTFSPTAYQCSGTPIQFQVTAPQEGLTYTWDFGDGETTTGTSVTHAFYAQELSGQDFIVKLTATNATGCSGSRSQVITVKGGPVINLVNVSNFRNCGGGNFELKVFDESTLGTDDRITYKIDWGHGGAVYNSTTAPAGVSHTYPVGIYKLTYSLVNANGCSVTKTYNVYNISNPAVSATSTGGTTGCAPLKINFPITGISSNHPSTTYVVDFGDGSPKKTYTHSEIMALGTISHTYEKSSCGSPGSPPNFPKDAFIFRIVATNSCGSTPAAVGGIRVYTRSEASFRTDLEKACAGIPFKFINTTLAGLNADCNTNTEYVWDFGDGTQESTLSISKAPLHTYARSGEYTVTLRAKNNCAETSFSRKIVVIAPPVARFTSSIAPTTACLDATVSTQNQSTGDELQYQWSVVPDKGYSLAGGTTLTSPEPRFIFNTAGSYHLRLRSYNTCKSDTTSRKILIKGLPEVVLPGPQTYCGFQTLTFGPGNEKHLPDYKANFGTITTYRWEVLNGTVSFENGTTAASANPVIRFQEPGSYEVAVTIGSECGSSARATQFITINPVPETPDITEQRICAGTQATFTLPAGPTTYRWYASATATSPIFTGATFKTPVLTADQTYYVEAVSPQGCVGTRKQARVLVTPVIANNTISGAQTLCLGTSPAAITGSLPTGGGAITYLWESSPNGATFEAAPGTNNQQHYNPGALQQTTWFRRRVLSPTCAPHVSAAVKIEIQQPISQNTISADQVICAGRTPARLTGTIPAGGNGQAQYQWQWRTETGTYVNAPNASTSQDYTPPALSQTTYFRRQVTAGVCAPSYSNEIRITVNPLPAAPTVSPATICANNTATLRASAPNGTIEWYSAASGGQRLATGIDFTTPVLTQTTTYYLQAVAQDCPSPRTPVTVTVKPAPVAKASPASLQICNGATTNIQLTSNIAGTTFSWTQTASEQISGASNGSGNTIRQQLFNKAATPATITYIVTPVFEGCAGNPVLIEVTVNPDLSNNTIGAAQTICANSQPAALTGSIPNGGSDQYTYLWEISVTSATAGFSPAPGANNKSDYQPGSLRQTTWFRRTVTSGGCSSVTPAVAITVLPAITNNAITASQVICSGSIPAPLTGQQPGGGTGEYSYSWEISLDGERFSPISGATQASFAPQALSQPTWFRRTVSSGPCRVSSLPVKIDIQQPITQNTISASQIICAGTAPRQLSGSLPAGGNNQPQYQWQWRTEGGTFVNVPTNSTGQHLSPPVLNQTTYFRRMVTAGVCLPSYSEEVQITVNPTITNNVITSLPETICTGTTPARLSATAPGGGDGTYIYTWEMSVSSPTAGFSAAPGTNTNPDYQPGILRQTTWFRRTVTSGGCSLSSAAVQITVNQPISNNQLGSDLVVCAGSAAPILKGTPPSGGNGTYQYIWQVSTEGPGSGFTHAPNQNNQETYAPGILAQTTWFRRIVISGPCENNTSAAIRVQVNEIIANNSITGEQFICAGSKPAALTGSEPTGGSGRYAYIWESSTTSATSGFKTAAGDYEKQDYAPGALYQTTWFRRRVVSAPCNPSISGVVEIKVTPALVNKVTAQEQVMCAGTPAPTIIGQAPTGGSGQYQISWESSVDNIVFDAAPGTNNGINYEPGILHQTTWYRRKIVSGACSNYSATVKVTANPPLSGNTIEGDQNLCMASTPALLQGSVPVGGNGQYRYLWESSTDNKTFAPAKGTNNTRDYQPGEIQRTTWFRRRVTAGSCEPLYSETVQISVTQGVSNNTIGVAQRICVGTSAAPLVGSTGSGGSGQITYRWEVSTTGSASGFSLAGGDNTGKDYEPGYLTKTSWFRRIIISGGCTSISRAVQITVDTNIQNNVISREQTICTQTAPATLTGSLPTGGTANYRYEWEYSTDGIQYTAAPGNNDQQHYTPPVLTRSTWFRRVVLSAPCGASESNTILITVVPVITQNRISGDQSICSGTMPARLTGSQPAGGTGTYTYLWEMSTDNSEAATSRPAPGVNNQADYTPPVLTQTTVFRRIVFSAPCQQLASNTVRILVKPIPPLPVVTPATTCKGQPAVLSASGPADNFVWYASASGGNPLFTGKTFTTPAIDQETTFYVESVSKGCASARVPVKASIYTNVAQASEDVTITKGQQTLLRASGGGTYSWQPATGLSAPQSPNTWATPEETTTYRVTVTSEQGCVTSDEVTVTVVPRIVASNGITPNGDGVNDTWVIKNIEFYPNAQVEIFNRWGNKVFSSVGYKVPWDGTLNGQPLPVAAYFYVIKLNNNEPPITGSITLVK